MHKIKEVTGIGLIGMENEGQDFSPNYNIAFQDTRNITGLI